MQQEELTQILEALLFASDEPLTMLKLREVLKEQAENAPTNGSSEEEGLSQIQAALETLKHKYSGPISPVVILEVAQGWQFSANPVYAPWIKKLFKDKMTFKVSQPALETLAIIAYRQPITRAEIEEIRGVEVIAALETLLEKNLVKVVGRKETVGRPLLYATTQEFMRQFGLRSLDDLPKPDLTPQAEAAPIQTEP